MMGNNFPATQAVGGKSVKFDAGKFQWLGTIAPVVETMAVWHTTGVKTVDDLRKRETVAGASGRGAITYFYPTMMNEFLGTKFKIVTGYPGGNQINLAMERGEVEARNNTWSSWKATRAGLAQGQADHRGRAGRPARARPRRAVGRGACAHARRPADHRADRVRHAARPSAGDHAGRAGGPACRHCAHAFRATMKDPEFLKDAAQMNFEVDPVYGEPMQKIVEKILSTPKTSRHARQGVPGVMPDLRCTSRLKR